MIGVTPIVAARRFVPLSVQSNYKSNSNYFPFGFPKTLHSAFNSGNQPNLTSRFSRFATKIVD